MINWPENREGPILAYRTERWQGPLVQRQGIGTTILLKCLGAVIEPTSGRFTLAGDVIYDNGWKRSDLRALRRDRIGFVFQTPYLIPFLDATDNVALLPMLAGVANPAARATARDMLTALDVQHRASARIPELSGGEQQRVAIPRSSASTTFATAKRTKNTEKDVTCRRSRACVRTATLW